jgi:hypothetical protein
LFVADLWGCEGNTCPECRDVSPDGHPQCEALSAFACLSPNIERLDPAQGPAENQTTVGRLVFPGNVQRGRLLRSLAAMRRPWCAARGTGWQDGNPCCDPIVRRETYPPHRLFGHPPRAKTGFLRVWKRVRMRCSHDWPMSSGMPSRVPRQHLGPWESPASRHASPVRPWLAEHMR